MTVTCCNVLAMTLTYCNVMAVTLKFCNLLSMTLMCCIGSDFDVFINRCYTEDGDVKLVISSSPDYKQDRRVFSGPNYSWSNFEIPGKFSHFVVIRVFAFFINLILIIGYN